MQSKASQGINMRNRFFLLCVLLLVGGVSGDQKVGVSVMDGDSVTLKPDAAEIQKDDDEIMWKYNGSIVARMKTTTGLFSTFDGPDKIFEGRLQLDNQTRYLTITNIRTTDSGTYLLHIRNSNETFKEFSVTVHDEMNTVSVKEGESVILRTGLIKMQDYDRILWKFEDHLMAEINIRNNRFSLYDGNNERFKGRLRESEKTVSLIISNSKTTDSGVYQLNMNSSSHTVQRIISVTVSGSGVSLGALAGIVVVLLVVFVAVVIYLCCKISKLQRLVYDAEEKGTDVSLKDGQQ